MLKTITGSCYKKMLRYGINHLDRYRVAVNDLNVFPVPDGDTGTNMVMTMKQAFRSIGDDADLPLSHIAQRFANAGVFGARGNSGVILSQFFKGISEGFRDHHEADCVVFYNALDRGCEYAYAAVSNPVEGTILTVIKDATTAIGERIGQIDTIDEVVDTFLNVARVSLANTPTLLPVLAKAGVVDSGASGVVYFFEGVQRYLNGEAPDEQEMTVEATPEAIDFSVFNRNSRFEYGYCTEILLQITLEEDAFDYDDFVSQLKTLGESLVVSREDDKVKVHIHTKYPEQILVFGHNYGEFLTLKIENMSVQHSQTTQKYLRAKAMPSEAFSIVAVAPNNMLQSMLAEMGADVVILSEEVPSSKDFIEAFELVDSRDVLVFPNSSNSILSAMQAASLYKKANITVLNCRSIAQCYAALPIIDFDETNISAVVSAVNDTIGNIYEVAIVHATKNIQYGNRAIIKNDYFALAGNDVLVTANQFESAVMQTVRGVTQQRDCGVLTMFYGKNISEKQIDELIAHMEKEAVDIEVSAVSTQNAIYDLVLSFE